MRASAIAAVLLAASVSTAGPALNPGVKKVDVVGHKLLPGAEGKLCIDCHEPFREKLNRPVLHTPVKNGVCVSCHNPHASNHGNLLAVKGASVCGTCHQSLVPKAARSVHVPVAEGRCGKCHDPHAAEHPNVLLKRGNALCSDCHAEFVDAVEKVSVKHAPVEKDGCTTCHDPHASSGAGTLLKKAEPGLCLDCHKATTSGFAKAHQGYPVAKTGCSTCHDPHGSNAKKMLRNHMHRPVAQRQCEACHLAPVAGKPLTTRKSGAALCQTCHADQVAAMMAKSQVHWAIATEDACLSCHDPHAASAPKLIDGKMTVICGRCHQDTIARHERSPTPHKPVGTGQCSACHDPHASNNPMLFKAANNIELCGTCHDWQKHSSHPIGETQKDARNPNLTMDCLSCHRAHGTEYKHLIPAATVSDLCTKCHAQYKR